VWLFSLQFRYELSYTYWAQLGFTWHHTPMTTAGTHSSETTWQEPSTTKKSLEDCDKSLLRNWATPATDQNCRRTSIYERSVISGSRPSRKREAHYTFLQHLIQRISNQRLYRDDMPTSPKRSTYLDIQTLPTLCLKLYIAGLLMTILPHFLLFKHFSTQRCCFMLLKNHYYFLEVRRYIYNAHPLGLYMR
jgi:hypothetical protein